MLASEAIKVVKTEIECVKRKSATNCCDCANCDLVLPDEVVLGAWDKALYALRVQDMKERLDEITHKKKKIEVEDDIRKEIVKKTKG